MAIRRLGTSVASLGAERVRRAFAAIAEALVYPVRDIRTDAGEEIGITLELDPAKSTYRRALTECTFALVLEDGSEVPLAPVEPFSTGVEHVIVRVPRPEGTVVLRFGFAARERNVRKVAIRHPSEKVAHLVPVHTAA